LFPQGSHLCLAGEAMGTTAAKCASCSEPCCIGNDAGEDFAPMVVQKFPGFSDNDGPQVHGNHASFAPVAAALLPQSGEQTVMYKDGSSYTGNLVDGRRDGHGMWRAATGSYEYEGQWRSDLPNGQGRQTWSDGRIYEGGFSDGIFDGFGRMEWQTQQGTLSYEGQYEKDVKHGKGKFLWPDGRGYDGEWVQGKRSGRGVYINSKGERKEGLWTDDKFDRWVTEDGEVPANTSDKQPR